MTTFDAEPAMTRPPSRFLPGFLRRIDEATCLHLLRTESVGRIAFADRSGPDLVPVNYVLDGADILIATTAFGVVATGSTGRRVAFEVDHIDVTTRSGWSVVVRGHARQHGPFEPAEASPVSWADGPRSYVLRIHPDTISGRQLPGRSPGVI